LLCMSTGAPRSSSSSNICMQDTHTVCSGP
jgi:hypothetical protein